MNAPDLICAYEHNTCLTTGYVANDKTLALIFSFYYIRAECSPDHVFKYVGENAIFASGSPFSNVSLGNSFLAIFNIVC